MGNPNTHFNENLRTMKTIQEQIIEAGENPREKQTDWRSKIFKQGPLNGPISAEIRVTDPKTGGQKGTKPARFDLIPPDFLWELAEVYGIGSLKYDDDNWLRGYEWHLSYAALQRHISKWVLGESLDGETGRHHLAMAAWHLATLYTYEIEGLGHDMLRWPTRLRKAEAERAKGNG